MHHATAWRHPAPQPPAEYEGPGGEGIEKETLVSPTLR